MVSETPEETTKPFGSLSRGFDYLGNLGEKLGNLQGYKTLANELVQNADDVSNATTILFDICDDALIVENDGVFSDCHRVEEDECPWKSETKGHMCDFHRFRTLAAGDKRSEAGTTGAFGIGFIAVYQITDRPELISNNRHWRVVEENPENSRIKICPGCEDCRAVDLPGTKFILPWAFDPKTVLREKLRVGAVAEDDPDRLFEELRNSIPLAMLFLKNLEKIEIKRNGDPKVGFKRQFMDNTLTISCTDTSDDQIWHLVSGDFKEKAGELIEDYPNLIEATRLSKVDIAFPLNLKQPGMLYACLPSEHGTGLPFQINAEFFPLSDRKRVDLDNSYQGKWNRAAIRGAAELLGRRLYELPKLLGPLDFWKLVNQVKEVCGHDDNLFSVFWENLKVKLKSYEVIFTSTNEWVYSRDAVLLQQAEEGNAISILEKLGLKIVNEELRPFQSLLSSEVVGVPRLDIQHVFDAFEKKGMVDRNTSTAQGHLFENRSELTVLWDEIKRLLARQRKYPTRILEDIKKLKRISLAPTCDGALWPGSKLYRADDTTISIFSLINVNILFVENDPAFAPLAIDLCPEFGFDDAIQSVRDVRKESIEQLWRDNKLELHELFHWFDQRREDLINNDDAKQKFKALKIFPSDGTLHRLADLSIPGDFIDPLGLAKLVDLSATGDHREFLICLGMHKLDFQIYAKQYLPEALQSADLSISKRREVLRLLAEKIGEIKHDQETQSNLRECELVECTDDEFRLASECYFDTPNVRTCLENNVHYVKRQINHNTISDLYKWIGVASEPRLSDLVTTIQEISNSAYSSEKAEFMNSIISYLGTRCQKTEEVPVELSPLRSLAWLPAKGKTDCWYKPDELFAAYRPHIFLSQALFLDVSQSILNDNRLLIEYLEIKIEPPVILVVDHLLHCVSTKTLVHKDVYRFLNSHVSDGILDKIKSEKCLNIGDEYFAPRQVLWGEHRFGRYRRRLNEEFRDYYSLLKRLGVRDNSNHEDALSVLKEISIEYGEENRPVDEESRGVLLECWRILEKAIQDKQLSGSTLSELRNVKCVVNKQELLMPASSMFFENRAGLAEKFGDTLTNNITPQPIGLGSAMMAAGIRMLGSAVDVSIIERADLMEDSDIRERVLARRQQLGRVLKDHQALSALERLEYIQFFSTSSLMVKYELKAYNRCFESAPESAIALFDKNTDKLIYKLNGEIRWSAIARELSIALFPEEDPGGNASSLKDIFAAETSDEADEMLDDLGFARRDIDVYRPLSAEPMKGSLGEEISKPDDYTAYEAAPQAYPDNEHDDVIGANVDDFAQPKQPDSQDVEKKTFESGRNSVPEVDYGRELTKRINRPGKTRIQERVLDKGKVGDLRTEKVHESIEQNINREPSSDERYKRIPRKVWEGKNYEPRQFLVEQYGGKCQICGQTFTKRNGQPYFEGLYLVSHTKARWLDREGNVLCLCANHSAQVQHGSIEEVDDIKKQIQDFRTEIEGGGDIPILRIRLCGDDCCITYTEKHFLDLQELLKTSEREQ